VSWAAVRAGTPDAVDDGTALGVTTGGVVVVGAVVVGVVVVGAGVEGAGAPVSDPPEQAVKASMRTAEQATARSDFAMGVSW